MGCFSFLCKKCGNPILSNSYTGQSVKLFLLKEGKTIEQMEGKYDSYGGVFGSEDESKLKWKLPWNDVCDLMFNPNRSNGIAAIHAKCYHGEIPCERSYDDPNQGWGEDMELFNDADPNRKI